MSDVEGARREPKKYSRREVLTGMRNVFAGIALSAAVPRGAFTERRPPPDTSKEVTLQNLHLILDKQGVPASYHFGDDGEPVLFTPEQIEQFQTRIAFAKRRSEYVPSDELLTDPSSYVPITDVIPAQNWSEQEASETPPEDICSPEELLAHGVIIHNPGPEAPNVLIRSGAFEPAGPLYPLSLLAQLEGSAVLELFAVNNIYLDDDTLTDAQQRALKSYEERFPGSILANYNRADSASSIEDFRRELASSHSQKITVAEQDGATPAELTQLYLESELIASISAANLLFHYVEEQRDFSLRLSMGITSPEPGTSQQLVMTAVGYPPSEFDAYSFIFDPSGKTHLAMKHVGFNGLGSKVELIVENRATSIPSPYTRNLLQGVETLAPNQDAYVVAVVDSGFILNHELTHARNNAVERLLELEMLQMKSDGTVEPVAGSRLEQLIADGGAQEEPWFMSQTYPIDMERKIDEATRDQMNAAFQKWLETGNDEGFPYVITVPPENGKPTRYKITKSTSDTAA